jgi:hypothetical protein
MLELHTKNLRGYVKALIKVTFCRQLLMKLGQVKRTLRKLSSKQTKEGKVFLQWEQDICAE